MQSGRASAAGAKGRKPALAAARDHRAPSMFCEAEYPGVSSRRLPPKSTVFGYLCPWRDAGVFTRINHCLVTADREQTGRQASPNAAVLSVKTTESGGPHGNDAGKEILLQGEGKETQSPRR